jgi:pimeloyl-ACP methyl ester carboxylesterase
MIAHSADGAKIAFQVQGEGPLALLFMHGWAGSGGYWDDLLRELDLTGLRAIAYDLRGHGASDKRDGFSMGAKFAQFVACTHGARVLGQLLVAGCPACEIPFPAEVRRDWSSRAGDATRLREVTSAYITRPVRAEVLDRWAADAAMISESVLDESLRICTDESFADRAAALRTPTLVVAGVHDPIFSPEMLQQTVVGTITGARMAVVDSNHEIPIEAPRELAGLISAFVAGLDPLR